MAEELKTRKSGNDRNSIVLLHLAVMLFGFSAVLGQFVSAPAVIIAGGRVIFSSITLLIFSLVTKASLKLRSKKDYGIALFTGVVLAVHWTTFFQSIQSSSVAIGTITFSAFPLFLTFLEPLVFHEKLKFRSVISALVLLLGVGITIPSFSLENETTIGIVWGLISALAYGVMSLSNRYLSGFYESRTICLYEQGTAAVVLLPALFLLQVQWTVENVVGIAAIGLVCTAIAHSLYVAAQRNVKAQTAGVISGMETVYGILFAFMFLGEVPGVRELIGGAIILGVAVFSSLTSSKK
jgi:drug/metabolite transporter (DMT)-like permease